MVTLKKLAPQKQAAQLAPALESAIEALETADPTAITKDIRMLIKKMVAVAWGPSYVIKRRGTTNSAKAAIPAKTFNWRVVVGKMKNNNIVNAKKAISKKDMEELVFDGQNYTFESNKWNDKEERSKHLKKTGAGKTTKYYV